LGLLHALAEPTCAWPIVNSRAKAKSPFVDAARRVQRNPEIPAWGLMLDAEGGPENEKLWKWYQDQNFKAAKADDKGRLGAMYAPLKSLIDI
jgi:hypothetical protein